LKGPKGVGPIFHLQVNKEGKYLGGTVIPTKQLGEGIPVYDEEKQALKQLIDLSLEDFPESPLEFSLSEGTMYKPVVEDVLPVKDSIVTDSSSNN
jgi:hypothetical protein